MTAFTSAPEPGLRPTPSGLAGKACAAQGVARETRAAPGQAGRLAGQQAQHRALRLSLGGELPELAGRAQLAEDGLDRLAALVHLDDAGVDVRGPGDSRRVAQVVGHLTDDA